MSNLEDIRRGWDFMTQVCASEFGSNSALADYNENIAQNANINAQNMHIKEINDAIDQLAKSINEHPYKNTGIEQFKGYVAEEMLLGTFNINAIRQNSEHRAWAPHSNEYGSVDIETNFGKSYSSKFSNSAQKAEHYQATLDVNSRMPKYKEQYRLIGSGQVDAAKDEAEKLAHKNMNTRPDVANAHIDTKKHLVDKIADDEGVESDKLTVKKAKQIAREAKNEGFDPEKHKLHKEQLLEEVQIDYINQALKAGLTAAAITAILQITPELFKAIDYLIKNKAIDVDAVKKSGIKVVTASGEAFLRGSIAYMVEQAIKNGLLGETMANINPLISAMAVYIILGTIKDSISVATGKISAKEMGIRFGESLIKSAAFLAFRKVGGIITQTLLPQLPGIGYAIGSLLGCAFAVAYDIGKKKFISFCVDTGFTCFGLVEQDYTVPEDILKDMGVQTIPVPKTEVNRIEVETIDVQSPIERIEYETVEIKVLRRGLIGINKIGYITA